MNKILVFISTVFFLNFFAAPVAAKTVCIYDGNLREIVCEEESNTPEITATGSAEPTPSPTPSPTPTPTLLPEAAATESGQTKGGVTHDPTEIDTGIADLDVAPLIWGANFGLAGILFLFTRKLARREVKVDSK